jgi:FKBP-type peptidyl-prolyl cis-trans isomerase FklB
MILIVILIVMAGGAVLSDAATPVAPGQSGPDLGESEPTSYAAGHALGRKTRTGLSNDGMGVDMDLLAKGFADALTGKDPVVSRREMTEIRVAVHHEMEARRVRRLLADSPRFRQLHDDNLERGRKFRELFAKQAGVVVLPSGAQYKVVKAGSGRSPGPDDTVVLVVRGQLLDRSVIDEGDTPFEVEVGGTLPGGAEILQLMSVGAQWQVVLPPELAYGVGGRHPDIGPNETVILTVDLLEITPSGGGRTR